MGTSAKALKCIKWVGKWVEHMARSQDDFPQI